MISSQTENALRSFLLDIPEYGVANDISRRQEFVEVWNQVINDHDVQNVISKMLFIPSSIPDLGQGLIVLKILDYLHGKEPRKQKFLFWTYQVEEPCLYDDIVRTKAEIIAVGKKTDNEGPDYKITYIYETLNGKKQWVRKTFGYDQYHAAVNGFTGPILNGYWRVGNRIPCQYRASHSKKHAISEPYDTRQIIPTSPERHPLRINELEIDFDNKSDYRNLNIRYDLPDDIWKKVPTIYEGMPGWIGFGTDVQGDQGIPYWFSFNENEKSISASVEPGGLQFMASNIDEKEWESWIRKFKDDATRILGFKVGEIEAGEVTHEIEWL